MRLASAALLVVLAGLLPLAPVLGQSGDFFNQRDDKYRLLGLKRAKEAYEVARQDFERQKELHSRQLISSTHLDQARRAFSDAEVNYQQSLLAVLFEEQYVSVTRAVKSQAPDGRKHVRLTLANTSGGSEEFRQLIGVEDDLFRSLQPDVTHNIYVSLLNDDNAIISQPYEAKVEELRFGEPKEIDFTLLQDLDAVTVMLIYGNGAQRNMKIFLQKDASVNRVLVQSEQFSQEVDLGESANFDLTLELFSGLDNTFSLEVVNLPKSINRYFTDSTGAARLSQVKFTESSRSKRAALKVTLPDRSAADVAMDAAIPFYVLVLPREKARRLQDLPARQWTEQEIKGLDIGFVRLELIPRGKGELLVRSPQLYYAIHSGESVTMAVDIVNEGSRRLDNTEVRADMPLGWSKEIMPLSIPTIGIGEEARVNMKFTPPEKISPGKYEVRLRTSATSNNQPVHATDKTVTIEIQPASNVLGTIAIVLALVGLVGGIVVYGIRLSRR
ncbi:MAG: NEW3 domain-containing protein [Candidatus Zixiibacteriota bacterium]